MSSEVVRVAVGISGISGVFSLDATPCRGYFSRFMLKRTPFYDFHVAAGAKFVDFAGWEMPILYHSIVDEHEQTRRSGSIFDVSHMGRLWFTGPDAHRFLTRVLTRNISDQVMGQSRYSLVCNEAGGVLDDVIVSREPGGHWLVVCNASNRDKLVNYFAEVRQNEGFDFELADHTEATAMVAIQGPKVIDHLAPEVPVDLRSLSRYHFETADLMFAKLMVFRSGYTGEDGVEIIMPSKLASNLIPLLADHMGKIDAIVKPAGLGARDTLRLEAGMPLYGHELTEIMDPLSAGLGWAVDLTKNFIGVEILRSIKHHGPKRRLVGLELQGKRIARPHTPILADQSLAGEVTSGTFSPTLQKSIAMAYVDAPYAAEGTILSVDLRGVTVPAKIVKLPFYKRTGK